MWRFPRGRGAPWAHQDGHRAKVLLLLVPGVPDQQQQHVVAVPPSKPDHAYSPRPRMSTPDPKPASPPKPRRSWPHRLFAWILRVTAVAALGLAVVTQSGVLAWLILPRIESALGCHASAGRVWITPSGLIIINGLRLGVPGIDGTGGTFLEVPRLEVAPRWSGLLSGTIPVEHIHAHRPTIRLSQDRNLDLNIVQLSGSTGGQVPDFVPAMKLTDAVLDLGEHGPGWYTNLVSLSVSGRLSRMGPGSPRYEFQLAEATPAVATSDTEPLVVKGEFDLEQRTGYLTLEHIDLARWQRVAVPESVRDYWGKLSMSGEVQDTTLSYTPKDGPVVSFSLKDVNLNIPIPAESDDDRARSAQIGETRPENALLAMKRVEGNLRFEQRGLRARLHGLIEDLPCTVRLETEGYDPVLSALTCHITAERFTLEERPKLLPFAPFYVKRNFKRFSGPNGVITGEVSLQRAAPPGGGDRPAPLKIQGRLDFEQGEAAFEKFPYPFTAMKGSIDFNEDEVRILGITGVGPTGAKLLAHGRVSPPNDEGMVEVNVTVVDVPVDAALREAVPARRKALLEYLFSEKTLAEFHADGHAPDREFELGGLCDIRVAVRRPFGVDTEYLTTIDVAMERAGLMSAAFPYPATGEHLRLHITDDTVRLRVPRLIARERAELALEADVTLAPPEQPDLYDVRVLAANLPCDEQLMRALPNRRTSTDGQTAQSFVRSLGLSGIVDGAVRIYSKTDGPSGTGFLEESPRRPARVLVAWPFQAMSRPGNGVPHQATPWKGRATTGFEVHASLAGLSSTIGGPGCLELTGLAGELIVTDQDAHALNLTGSLGDGSFAASIAADRAPPRPSIAVDADVTFDRLPLGEPVEELVALADPTQGDRLRRMRSQYRPEASVTGNLRLTPTSQGTAFALAIHQLDDFSATLFDGTLSLRDASGGIGVTNDRASFHNFTAALDFDSQPAGTIALNGRLAISEGHSESLAIIIPEGRFESPLVQAAVKQLRPRLAATLDRLQLAGEFALTAEVHGPSAATSITGIIEPRSLALTRNDKEIRFDRVSGAVRFGPSGGKVSDLRAFAPEWAVSAEGRWASDPTLDIDLSFGFESQGIPPDLLAALPSEAAGAFDAVHLNLTGPLTLNDTRLRTIDNGTKLQLTAHADAGAASLDIGLPITFDRAAAALEVVWPLESQSPPTVSADLTIPEFRASRATLSNGRVRINSGNQPGTYELGAMAATMHGGTLTASASFVQTASSDPDKAYTAELRAARVDFASLLNDLHDPESPEPFLPSAPGSRGEIDAAFTLTGTLGRADDRRGRGSARVSGGEVIALPGAMPMLRLSNLQPPMGEPLESAVASFYLQGDTLTFEQLQASSESLLIVGRGTITLPETRLDLRMNSQGRGTIPIFDDILRGLRNQIMTTVVTGTVAKPEYRIEAFPGTQRMLGTIFQGKPTELPPAGAPDQETK